LTKDQKTTVALETMAGKGTEIGRSFEEIAKIVFDKFGFKIEQEPDEIEA